jgi:hypothetical protein
MRVKLGKIFAPAVSVFGTNSNSSQITVPDLSFTGVLSTLAISIDFSQYLLLRGLLMFNIGECLDDLTAQDEEMASSFYQVKFRS